MSIARDILRANNNFYQNYGAVTGWHNGRLVMKEGVVIDSKWYIDKVGCFLIDLLQKRKKRGGVNEW
ncbi:hypothetical protein LCGC14_0611140 [marine sediment metagenome]|uniref:Uncharacterized protein n=1 Tax=marine sediment metagenome TaxID=412755 RepID=A0A0F9RRU5_9ZZZZ